MGRLGDPIRGALRALRDAMSNDGIRRLEIAWMLGIAADVALLVVLLVVVYERDGVVATGLLGAVRMVPAVVAGMLSGAILERFRGDRILVAIGLIRAISAAACGLVIASGGPTVLIFIFAAVAAAAGAPVRPTQATLMPALARSPRELVAANTAWSTGEGIGAFAGPFVAGVLIASGNRSAAAFVAAIGFLLATAVVVRLRFEQAADATGGAGAAGGGLRLGDGLRALRRRPVPGWTMFGVFGQVLTRGLLNALIVVASVELLAMGDPGVGLLTAAIGLGGLLGAVFAMTVTRTDQLVRTACVTLAYWGAPIAVIALLPFPAVALAAMVVTGVANAIFDVALFTVFQRGTANDERAPVFSVFEGVVGVAMVTGSVLAPVLVAVMDIRGALGITGAFLPILALVIYSRIGRAGRIAVVDEEVVQLLREVPAFAELPMTAVERLAAGLRPVAYAEGSTLLRQGELGDEFIVINTGEVDVSVDGAFIQRLGRGNGIGEIALLHRSPRSATVVAATAVTAYSVACTTFMAAIAGPAAAAVTERMAAAHLARSSAATP